MNNLRIVFMGTPEFAVPSLEILVEHGYNIVGVITSPDRAKGRGLQVVASPVKAKAIAHNLNVLQPENLKDQSFLDSLKKLHATLQVVVAFRMLPEAVWSMPELGTFNLHASLLPKYRGAAPINWAIINGEEETGLTTFFLQHEIDTGNIMLQEKEPIFADDNAGSLHDRLKIKGASLVLKTVRAIEKNEVKLTPQSNEDNLLKAPKIYKKDCEINWDQPAPNIHNLVRGLAPYPAAWAILNGTMYKILETEVLSKENDQEPGTIVIEPDSAMVKASDAWIRLIRIQKEGKKPMHISEFLKGNSV